MPPPPRRRAPAPAPAAAAPAALLLCLCLLHVPPALAGGGPGKRGTEFTPSVVLTKQDEYGAACRSAVDRAFGLGAANVKFVPTVFYYGAKVRGQWEKNISINNNGRKKQRKIIFLLGRPATCSPACGTMGEREDHNHMLDRPARPATARPPARPGVRIRVRAS